MFRFLKDNEDPWMILIETQGDPFAAKEAIGKVYEKVTGLEFEAYFMDERLQNSFDSQIRLAKIVIVFSIIAILISLLGLLAMSTYLSNSVCKKYPYERYLVPATGRYWLSSYSRS